MNEKNYEQLIRDHPDLFEKSYDQHIGVGDGWFNIIDTLCGLISYDVRQARFRLKYAMENQGKEHNEPISVAEERLKKALEDLPIIDQVKEKFGSLRFYVSGGNDKIDNYITFAECMSSVTCEECGAPGEKRSGGWVKVLCDKHYKAGKEENDFSVISEKSKSAPKLSDEDLEE